MPDFKAVNDVYLTDYSGNRAIITSGVGQNVVLVSGSNVVRILENFGLPLTTTFVLTSSGSGGVALSANTSSYPYGIVVKNASNTAGVSGVILLGSSGSPPFISGGYPLMVGESIRLNVMQPSLIRVYGGVSGVGAAWIGQLG